MIQGDGDYLLEEFHEADILLPEEREAKRVEQERANACVESTRFAYEMQRAFGLHVPMAQQFNTQAQRGAAGVGGGVLGAAGLAALSGGASSGSAGLGVAGLRMFGMLP